MSNRRILLPLFAALLAAGIVLAFAACGSSDSKEVVEGEVVKLGDVEYTVTFSRYLNPNDSEDAAYLVGQEEPQKGNTFFGVFFEVQNDSEEIQKLPANLLITDADGEEFKSIPSESEFALQYGGEIEPEEQVPVLDSPAQQGPIEGVVTIFELDPEASSNRPLTLHIESPEGEKAEVELDL